MKVYFIGAESSGKSTLCRYVSEKYNLKMIGEVARKVLSEKEIDFSTIRGNIKLVNDYQNQVFTKQLEIENELENNYVLDRNCIDAIAYSISYSTISANLFWSNQFQGYVKNLQNKNAIIFKVSPNKETMKQDGIREQLVWDNMIAIDSHIKFILEIYELPYIQINTSNPQERIRLINTVLKLNNTPAIT